MPNSAGTVTDKQNNLNNRFQITNTNTYWRNDILLFTYLFKLQQCCSRIIYIKEFL